MYALYLGRAVGHVYIDQVVGSLGDRNSSHNSIINAAAIRLAILERRREVEVFLRYITDLRLRDVVLKFG